MIVPSTPLSSRSARVTVFPLYVSGYWLAIRLATAVNTASARALSTPSRKRTKVATP